LVADTMGPGALVAVADAAAGHRLARPEDLAEIREHRDKAADAA
jgi:hypothetical protein